MLLREKNPSYLVFMAKVPLDMGFVNNVPADMIIVRFSEIFNLFHLKRLDHSLIFMFSLSLSMTIRRDQTQNVAILDPFYMRESVLMDDGEAIIAAGYIRDFMLENMSKDLFLTTYSPSKSFARRGSISFLAFHFPLPTFLLDCFNYAVRIKTVCSSAFQRNTRMSCILTRGVR